MARHNFYLQPRKLPGRPGILRSAHSLHSAVVESGGRAAHVGGTRDPEFLRGQPKFTFRCEGANRYIPDVHGLGLAY